MDWQANGEPSLTNSENRNTVPRALGIACPSSRVGPVLTNTFCPCIYVLSLQLHFARTTTSCTTLPRTCSALARALSPCGVEREVSRYRERRRDGGSDRPLSLSFARSLEREKEREREKEEADCPLSLSLSLSLSLFLSLSHTHTHIHSLTHSLALSLAASRHRRARARRPSSSSNASAPECHHQRSNRRLLVTYMYIYI